MSKLDWKVADSAEDNSTPARQVRWRNRYFAKDGRNHAGLKTFDTREEAAQRAQHCIDHHSRFLVIGIDLTPDCGEGSPFPFSMFSHVEQEPVE